ncbi:MAG: division/cell wall cluster transcriptional repressor MraZ [Planctomycetes bacterium]|nr:division/cell wall cluster transcriptional repressor MraZ [Planctomycetota bacterium]
MGAAGGLLIGEFVRTLDGRFRLSLPVELSAPLLAGGPRLIVAKERAGCLSLWAASTWRPRFDAAVDVLRSKLEAGLLAQRVAEVQQAGRLLSARHASVSLAGRDRLVIPEGFRSFLGTEPGHDVVVVGAVVCVELWHPQAWQQVLTAEMPDFRRRLDALIG